MGEYSFAASGSLINFVVAYLLCTFHVLAINCIDDMDLPVCLLPCLVFFASMCCD